eukprot:367560_1
MHSVSSIFSAETISFFKANRTKQISNKYLAINMSNGMLLMFNVILDNDADILYNDINCDINCLQMINNSAIIHYNCANILQIFAYCDIEYNETMDRKYVSSLQDTRPSFATFKSHWSPYSINLTTNNQYYPGGKLFINHSIMDMFNNPINNYKHEIHMKLSSHQVDLQSNILIDNNGYCQICEQGIYIQTLNIDNVGNNFTIIASVDDNELISNQIEIIVMGCPSGYGKSGNIIKQCEICDDGYFSLYVTTNECISCSDNEFDTNAISCNGRNNLIINYNYWMKLTVTEDENYIISSICPPFMCCQDSNGCHYINSKNLCKYGRNPNSYLCSQCLEGYAELIGSSSCGICEKNYLERMIIPMVIAMLIALFVIFSTSEKREQQHKDDMNVEDVCFKNKELFKILKIMIIKPISYYFQVISYILTHNEGLSISAYLSSFIQIFNFSFDSTSAKSTGYCFLSHMNARDEILLNLSISFLAMLFLLIFYVLSQLLSNMR